ncbi:DMT family transporter [Streptomyces sp. AV19]|uniref:DMT family transporter n=1 Tax=Streptomyces sp. AV19 TaxID=2793068 RepID=UPI002412F381|nr:DMT family transporter [Streptomyces sp. AV19]MDG4536055.1 DMT family transporter [Streptomyces sp. AV19]
MSALRTHRAVPAGVRLDLALLLVAVSGMALSAPLIASITAAPALAIAFWRNAMAVGALTPLVLLRHRAELKAMGRRAVLLTMAGGALLALHFGVWLPSLSMTSVASSTALVTTTPIWTVVLMRLGGRRRPGLVWAGTALAFLGVVILTGVDLSGSPRALAGDALALVGGMAAAGYVLLGAEVRRTVGTVPYTFVCYTTTTVLLLVACLVSGASLAGYDGGTWGKLVLLTAAAQLLGHSLINRVVKGLGPSVTSTAILLETPGAALIAAFWLGQTPPVASYPALAVILGGLALVILADRRAGRGRAAEPAAGVPVAEEPATASRSA